MGSFVNFLFLPQPRRADRTCPSSTHRNNAQCHSEQRSCRTWSRCSCHCQKSWLGNKKKSSETWRVEVAIKSPLNQAVYFHGLDTFEGMPKNDEKNFNFHEKSFLSSYEKVLGRILKLNF